MKFLSVVCYSKTNLLTYNLQLHLIVFTRSSCQFIPHTPPCLMRGACKHDAVLCNRKTFIQGLTSVVSCVIIAIVLVGTVNSELVTHCTRTNHCRSSAISHRMFRALFRFFYWQTSTARIITRSRAANCASAAPPRARALSYRTEWPGLDSFVFRQAEMVNVACFRRRSLSVECMKRGYSSTALAASCLLQS